MSVSDFNGYLFYLEWKNEQEQEAVDKASNKNSGSKTLRYKFGPGPKGAAK